MPVVPAMPSAIVTVNPAIIVLRALDPLARAVQCTFECAPLAGAVVAVPLEALLHARDSPLIADQSPGFTARQLTAVDTVLDAVPLPDLTPVDLSFKSVLQGVASITTTMAKAVCLCGRTQPQQTGGNDGQKVTVALHLIAPHKVEVGVRWLPAVPAVILRNPIVVLGAVHTLAGTVQRFVQLATLVFGVMTVTAETPVHAGNLSLIVA